MTLEHSNLPIKQFKNKLAIILSLSLIFTVILILFGASLSYQLSVWNKHWNNYSNQISASAQSLNEIKTSFGYGGFIHSFKNYVLRQTPELIPVIKNNLHDTYSAINKYKEIAKNQKEHQALEKIRKVVDKYQKNFILVQQLIKENNLPNYIDKQVKIDDTPALLALSFLHNYTFNNIQVHNQQTQRDLEKFIFNLALGFLVIPLFFGVNWILYKFISQMTLAARELDHKGQYLNDIFNAIPDAILIVDVHGNIIKVNEEALPLFKYSQSELLNLNIEQLMPASSKEGHKQFMQMAFQRQQKIPSRHGLNLKIKTKDSIELPVEISINFSLFNEEKMAIVSIRDISESRKMQNQLKNNEKMLNIAQSIAHIGSWDWDLKSNNILWSDEIYSVFGFSKNDFGIHYDSFVQHLHPDDREDVVNALNSTVVMNTPLDMEHRIIREDNAERIVHLRGEIYLEDEKNKHLVGTLHDITLIKQIESNLRMSDNVFRHTDEGIFLTDHQNKIIKVNPAFSKITGYIPEEAIGKDPKDIFNSGRHDREFYSDFWETLIHQGSWRGEIWNRNKKGDFFPSWQNISTIKDDKGNIIQYLSIFSDITDKKIAEENIHNLAQYDQLTQLPNRNLFNDRLEQALKRAQRSDELVGIMFIDLDRFKSVNDSLGHQAGDQLLQQVSERLKSCVRNQDTVARLGGDEFTIILEQLTQAEHSAIVANQVLSRLSEKVELGQHSVSIGGSIGISIYPTDAINSDNLIKHADMAMYQAKHLGKNQYRFYTDELSNQANDRFFIENRLNLAIDNNEFELYYQPQINTETKQIFGAEALIRWNDPDRGLIQPNHFLPMAEELGLINKIGEWVISNACNQTKKWQKEGYPFFKVSVNISGQQIIHGDIVNYVAQTLKETQLSPEYLELELLENLVMQQPEKVINTIKELRNLGVSLAIDDFGTGYSSLSYLKKLTIDRLKIDRSFVSDIPSDKDDKAIVSTIISMAKNLGLSVIAEGVENKEHISFLSENNCIEMQGFYYSKPLAAQDFAALLKKKNAFK